jgi:hypothetical protein
MLLLYTRAKYLSINKGRRKDWREVREFSRSVNVA